MIEKQIMPFPHLHLFDFLYKNVQIGYIQIKHYCKNKQTLCALTMRSVYSERDNFQLKFKYRQFFKILIILLYIIIMFRISLLILQLQTVVVWSKRIYNIFFIMTIRNVFSYRIKNLCSQVPDYVFIFFITGFSLFLYDAINKYIKTFRSDGSSKNLVGKPS